MAFGFDEAMPLKEVLQTALKEFTAVFSPKDAPLPVGPMSEVQSRAAPYPAPVRRVERQSLCAPLPARRNEHLPPPHAAAVGAGCALPTPLLPPPAPCSSSNSQLQHGATLGQSSGISLPESTLRNRLALAEAELDEQERQRRLQVGALRRMAGQPWI